MVGNNFGKWVPGKTVQDGSDHPKTSSEGRALGFEILDKEFEY